MKTERFLALDAWRGICALVVAFEHLPVANVLQKNAFIHHGYRFVDFFFVLSGFVIAHAYGERLQQGWAQTRGFLIRRIGRLWPLHLTLLLTFVLFELGLIVLGRLGISLGHEPFTDRNTPVALVANVFLIHGLGLFDRLTWNTPSWSISVEAFAYVFFAVMCALAPRRRVVAAAAIVGLAALGVLLSLPRGMGATYDFGVFRCLFGFMAGVGVRALWGRIAPRTGTLGEVLVVVAIVAAVTLLPVGRPAVLVTPLFAVAVWIFASEDGALSRALLRRGPQALGAWSYSIYMVHVLLALVLVSVAMIATKYGYPVFARIDDRVAIVGPAWFTTLVMVGYGALVVLIASLTYRYVEMPGQRWFGRWAKSRG